MFIKQLRLQNFRGIKNLLLDFDITQQVVVLVGVNGVGKSSVLDCISSLVRSYTQMSSLHGIEDLDINKYKSSIFGGRDNFEDRRDVYIGESSTCNGISAAFNTSEISWEIEKNTEGEYGVNIPDNVVLSIVNNSFLYCLNPFVAVYYSANRGSFKMNIKHYSRSDPDSHSDIVDFKEFTSWFKNSEDLENETRLSIDDKHRDIKLEATRTAVYSILDDGFSNLRMKRAIDKLTIHKAGQEIELDWLSDGERGLLALAGDLARRLATTYPDSPNPLQEEGLVLIDEIELHLHPAWQRIIIQRLTETFPKCQFIVTTHSPQVLSNIQPECIHILALEDGNVVVKRPERSFGRDSNRILEDIMGVTKRPPAIEKKILELFRVIHDGGLDQAKEMIQDLATEIGLDEPELIRASSTIRRREVIGR